MKKYFIIAGLLVAAYFLRVPILEYSLQRDVTFNVTRAERVTDAAGGTARYLIFTDQGVYQNVDDWLFLKWNSSDVQGKMNPGAKVTAKITGMRLGIFSWYPNIIKVIE